MKNIKIFELLFLIMVVMPFFIMFLVIHFIYDLFYRNEKSE